MLRARDFFKVKVVLFLGYDGRAFNGMQFQRQQGFKSIENYLCDAMLEHGLLRQENMDELKRIHLSRGARTDKRVHALLNAVSIKLDIMEKFLKDREQVQPPGVSKAKDKFRIDWAKLLGTLNAQLPEAVRLFAGRVVTKSFDIRHDTKHRTYAYLMPGFVFLNQVEQEAGAQLSQARAEELLPELQKLADLYKGTHTFSNFTRGYKPDDKRCVRYILDMQVALEAVKGQLFFRFRLVGQSFIYHQIRKMVGLVVQLYCEDHMTGVARSLPEKQAHLNSVLKEFGTKVYLAPGEGLYLEKLGLEGYNFRDNIPEPLLLNAQETKVVEAFRQQLQECMQAETAVFRDWILTHLRQETAIQAEVEEQDDRDQDE